MAVTTPNLGLRIWNDLSDAFDHDQLADNFAKIDFHDHSPGRGQPIPVEGLADGSITSDKFATGVGVNDSATTKSISFSAYRNAAYSGVATGTQLVFDTQDWDHGGWYETTGIWTPLIAGVYRVSACAEVSTDLTANQFAELCITVNGTILRRGPRWVQPAANPSTETVRIGVSGLVLSDGDDAISIKTTSSASLAFVVGS